MGAVSCGHGPRPCTCVQGLKNPTSAHELPATSFLTVATVGAQLPSPRRHLWNSPHLHNSDIDHLVQEQLRNLHGQRDRGGRPLRRDREDDDLWNPHDLHNGDLDHLVHVQLGISMVRRTVWTMGKISASRQGSTKSAKMSFLVHTDHDAKHHGPARC